jgi:hypothetical protein
VLLLACAPSTERPPPRLDGEVGLVDTLRLTALVDAPIVRAASRIGVTAYHVWIADGAGDPGIHVFARDSLKHVHSFGAIGRGPNSFDPYPFDLLEDLESDDAVWGFDPGNRRIIRFVDESPFADARLEIHLPDGARTVLWMDAGTLLVVRRIRESRFTYLDRAGNEVGVYGTDLPPGPDDATMARSRVLSSTTSSCARPDGSRFVLARRTYGTVSIYGRRGNHVGEAKSPFPEPPPYSVNSSTGEWTLKRERYFYMDCVGTQDRFLLLFTGGHAREAADLRLSGQFVHVFDWAGDFERTLALPGFATGIALSPDNRVLYGVDALNREIFAAELPDWHVE